MITINNKQYEFIENITLYEFIRMHKIFMPYFNETLYKNIKYDISYVELEGSKDVVNSKETYLEDNMIIYTNSKKVHTFLYNLVKEKKIELKEQSYQSITLNEDEYNILLCQPECYIECLEKYKDKGFNDIISTKLGHMIACVEMCNTIMERAIHKYDTGVRKPLVMMLQSIIDLPQKYQLNIKPASEILSQLIKNFYKEKLHINKKINIVYVTKSVICLITHEARNLQYNSYIDNIVELDYFDVTNNSNCFDETISKTLYKEKCPNIDVSMNFNIVFKILQQMGFKENSLEISTTSYGKEIISGYKDMKLKCLFTEHFLTVEEIEELGYDFIMITTRKQTMYINSDEGYLTDYNLNKIYKNILIRPGYSDILKRY